MLNIIYKLLYLPVWLFALLPFYIIYPISDFLAFILFYIIRYRKKVVFKNLRNALPGRTDKEIYAIARKFYKHLSDFMLEIVKIIHMSQKQVDKRFKYQNIELFNDLFEKGKDVALISGHYGNWEWMTNFQIKLKHQLFCIYRPLKNKFFNTLILNIRSKYGITMVPMKSVYKDVLNYKQKNHPVVVYFLGDQRPPRRSKFWTTFLNQETPFYTGFEKMAKKLNMAVMYMLIQKTSRGHYCVRFELLYENSNEVPDLEMTNKFIKTLEESIIKEPEYWLWSHNRWKHKSEIVE